MANQPAPPPQEADLDFSDRNVLKNLLLMYNVFFNHKGQDDPQRLRCITSDDAASLHEKLAAGLSDKLNDPVNGNEYMLKLPSELLVFGTFAEVIADEPAEEADQMVEEEEELAPDEEEPVADEEEEDQPEEYVDAEEDAPVDMETSIECDDGINTLNMTYDRDSGEWAGVIHDVINAMVDPSVERLIIDFPNYAVTAAPVAPTTPARAAAPAAPKQAPVKGARPSLDVIQKRMQDPQDLKHDNKRREFIIANGIATESQVKSKTGKEMYYLIKKWCEGK